MERVDLQISGSFVCEPRGHGERSLRIDLRVGNMNAANVAEIVKGD